MTGKIQNIDDKLTALKAALADVWDYRLDGVANFDAMSIDEVLALTVQDLIDLTKENPERFNITLSKVVQKTQSVAEKLEL